MAQPTVGFLKVSAKAYPWPFDVNELLPRIQDEAKQGLFTSLEHFLKIVASGLRLDKPSSLVRSHALFCAKLLPHIQDGVDCGKLGRSETVKKVIPLFARAGIFQLLEPGTNMSKAILCGANQAKVPVIRLALLMQSPLYAQQIEKRMCEMVEQFYPRGDVSLGAGLSAEALANLKKYAAQIAPEGTIEVESGLSEEALAIQKTFYEKGKLPEGPFKPGLLLELCKWETAENSQEEIGIVNLVRNALRLALQGRFIWRGVEPKPEDEETRLVRPDEIDAKELLRSLFQINTSQDAADCIALICRVHGGWDSQKSREKLLIPLFRILADFKTEECLRLVNALLAEMQNGLQRLEERVLEAANDSIEAEGGASRALALFCEQLFSSAKKQSLSSEDIVDNLFANLEHLGYRDYQYINIARLQSKCVNRIFKAQDIRTYHLPEMPESDKDAFGIGLEVLPIMRKDTRLAKFLQEHFKAIMISKERVSQVADLLRDEQRYSLDNITHIYTEIPLDELTVIKLHERFPKVRSFYPQDQNIICGALNETEESKNLRLPESSDTLERKEAQQLESLLEDYPVSYQSIRNLNEQMEQMQRNHKNCKEQEKESRKEANDAKEALSGIQVYALTKCLKDCFELPKRGGRSAEEITNSFLKLAGQLTHFDSELLAIFKRKSIFALFDDYDMGLFFLPKPKSEDESFAVGLEALPFMMMATESGQYLRDNYDTVLISQDRGLPVLLACLLNSSSKKSEETPLSNIRHIYSEIPLDSTLIAELKALFPSVDEKTIITCKEGFLKEVGTGDGESLAAWDDPGSVVLSRLESKRVKVPKARPERVRPADSDSE